MDAETYEDWAVSVGIDDYDYEPEDQEPVRFYDDDGFPLSDDEIAEGCDYWCYFNTPAKGPCETHPGSLDGA